MTAPSVGELVLADESGVWAIRSTSETVYYVDADSDLLLRKVGPGSAPGFADDRWAPLIRVEAVFARDAGVIRVGDRHKYTYDFDPDGDQYGFWFQRLVTSIDYVEAEELAGLPAFPQDDPL
ncbi:hypothetical protein [Cellulomonas sp. GbtcB1]|uniref:hypothetical protein n=1 Tax=Cellulomonas sp. GbtcB1 TaxID=2824746 RepID=UPI001C300E42|nr:hypothetical protein [Cellulomonas sp. GbtcB1]